jgi:hypothetical protein
MIPWKFPGVMARPQNKVIGFRDNDKFCLIAMPIHVTPQTT